MSLTGLETATGAEAAATQASASETTAAQTAATTQAASAPDAAPPAKATGSETRIGIGGAGALLALDFAPETATRDSTIEELV